MPRTIDVQGLKAKSTNAVSLAIGRYDGIIPAGLHYMVVRWVAQMTAVEIHAIWERYVENRLVAALNHHPSHFLKEHNIKGVSRVSSGLAVYVVRGGGRYFDFRSMSDLVDRGDRWLGKTENPFRSISSDDCSYVDALAAIRNCIVHRSEAAVAAYKRCLRSVYGIKYSPDPDEFLNAVDARSASPARYMSRVRGLANVVDRVIRNT